MKQGGIFSRAALAAASVAALALAGCSGNETGKADGDGYSVERVAFVMRHGIRPPTKDPAIPEGYFRDPWPKWDVETGLLTKRGAEGVALLGEADRIRYVAAGLLPETGCPAEGLVVAEASWKQRTIDTGKAYLGTLVPGCTVAIPHPDSEEDDKVFHPFDAGKDSFDGHIAYEQALALAPGRDITAAAKADASLIGLLQDVLQCCSIARCREEASKTSCTLSDIPTELIENKHDAPELDGPLSIGSTASQTFLLEYLEGMPMDQVGWGRVTRDQIETLLEFHPIKFRYQNGSDYAAAHAAGPLMQRLLGAMTAGEGAPRFTLFFGHDTNIADLGALLDVDWKVESYPGNDIPPGGALGFELVKDSGGKRYVRAFFRAQTMDQLRNQVKLTGEEKPFRQELVIPGCKGPEDAPKLCPVDQFEQIVQAKLALGATS